MINNIFIFTLVFSLNAGAKDLNHSFNKWKKSYIKKAQKRGLSKKFLKKYLDPLKLNTEVIEKDKSQITANKKIDYQNFMKKWKRDGERIELAKKYLKQYDEILSKVENKFGVDKKVIIALWGVETLYGQITGDFDLIESLSSLAFDGRRKKFFELQLNAAFRLIKRGHVKRDLLKGSWAGATGQCQFMPSNINAYAVDFNGDGKKDIWNTPEDIFASMANLLKKAGWKRGSTIGSLALAPKGRRIKEGKDRTKAEFNKLGFRSRDLSLITSTNWKRRKFSYIPFQNSPIVLRGGNYNALMKWNKSSLFAALVLEITEKL